MRADRVEERQRAAAGADHEAEVAVELGDVAGHTAVIHRVDGLTGDLERRCLAGFARLLIADTEVDEQLLGAAAGLVLHVHVRVECDERPVGELADRVDLGERHVVLDEQLREPRQDRDELVQVTSGHARGGDDFLRGELAEGEQVREVAPADFVGLILGDLLDVDAADGREDHHRLLPGPVPDNARVQLLDDLGLRVDEDAARHMPVDLQLEYVRGMGLRFVRRVGELHAARLHAAA